MGLQNFQSVQTRMISTVALVILVGIFAMSPQQLLSKSDVLGIQQSKNTLPPKIEPIITFSEILEKPQEIPVKHPDVSDVSVYAESAIVIDEKTLTPLFAKNPLLLQYPASTTKLATALIALQTYELSQTLTVPSNIREQSDGSSAQLLPMDVLTVKDLIYALLVGSANDAAYTLAINDPSGGYNNFISNMNQLAKNLNLSSTHFTNPIGYDESTHVTSAFDLAVLTQFALKEPFIRTIVDQTSYTFTSVSNPSKTYTVTTTNQLLGTVEGVTGVKTGWTPLAQGLLIVSVTRNDHTIIIVIANSPYRENDAKDLIEWTYRSYVWE